jgi:hypothetical protein
MLLSDVRTKNSYPRSCLSQHNRIAHPVKGSRKALRGLGQQTRGVTRDSGEGGRQVRTG